MWQKFWLAAKITSTAKFNFSNSCQKSRFFFMFVLLSSFFRLLEFRYVLNFRSSSFLLFGHFTSFLSFRVSLFSNIGPRKFLASFAITPRQNCHRLRKYLSASARADRRVERKRSTS